ncbi:MAG: thiamine pyrophosphate-dependent enzyme [Bacillota bacterium]
MTGGFARTIQTYLRPERLPTIWCQGCGNGIVIGALIRALAGSGVRREDVVVVSGIGCSGRASGYLNLPGFQPTHGRALPFATGVKIANPSLMVVAIMGDGDCLSIGGNHFLHAARRNLDITALVLNNSNYGMTGGQYAPTTPKGGLTTTTPYGNAERAVDIPALAQVAGATYVARSTSYHALELSGYIKRALVHRGFSVVEALCHCPTQYGKMNRLGSPVNMLKLQRDLAVSQARAASMPAGELAGRIITGEMVKPEGQGEEDYTTAYARVIKRAMEQARPVEETHECIPSLSGGYDPPLGKPTLLRVG